MLWGMQRSGVEHFELLPFVISKSDVKHHKKIRPPNLGSLIYRLINYRLSPLKLERSDFFHY